MSDRQLDEQIVAAVLAFVNADTWHDSKRIVREHNDELLNDEADMVLAVLLYEYREDQDMVYTLEEHRALLARCRRVGIDGAFANRLHTPEIPGIPTELAERLVSAKNEDELRDLLMAHPELLSALQELMDQAAQDPASGDLHALMYELRRLTRLSDIPRRIEVCLKALKLIKRDEEPEAWAALHGDLGDSLEQNPIGDRAENLEHAIRHYKLALEVYTEEAFPKEREVIGDRLVSARRSLALLRGQL